MKKTFVKSLILMLALVFTLSFAVAFSACNKNDKPAPDTSREDARTEFVSNVMLARDDVWHSDLADEELAVIDNAGDYIVALNWTTFVADVLYDSGLQTAKIKKINSVLAGETGRQLIADIESKQYDYIPVLKDMGLTEDDVEEIVFNGLVGIFEKSEGIFDVCISRAEDVKLISQNGTARENLDNVIASSKRSKDAMLSTSTQELKETLLGVEDSIKCIIKFAYDTALLFGNEGDSNLIKTLTSGALEDANANEIALYLESAFDSVASLKAQLTDESLASIGNAVGLIIDKMEGVTVTSEVFSSIISAMKYVYAFIDFLPYACDYVGSIGEYITSSQYEYKNIQTLLDAYFGDEYVEKAYDEFGVQSGESRYNLSVPVAQALLAMLGIDYSSDDSLASTKTIAKANLDALLDKMCASAKVDYKKSVVFMYIDVLFQGENAVLCEFTKLDAESIDLLVNIVVTDAAIGSFRSAYAKNAKDKTDRKGLVNTISTFNKYLGKSMTVPAEVTYEWFKSVLDEVRGKLVADVESLLDKVVENVKTNVGAIYDANVDGVVAIAKMQVAKVDTSEYQTLKNKLAELKVAELFEK